MNADGAVGVDLGRDDEWRSVGRYCAFCLCVPLFLLTHELVDFLDVFEVFLVAPAHSGLASKADSCVRVPLESCLIHFNWKG